MSEKSYNIVLYDKRKELKLSRWQAAKKLHISSLSLFLYEKGYYVIPKNRFQRFIDAYNLPSDFFTNDLLYPSPLNKTSKKELKREGRLHKFVTHTATRIVLFLLLAGCIATIPFGYMGLSNATTNIASYYTDQFNGIRQATIKNGEKSTEKSTGFVGYTYSKDFKNDAVIAKINYFFYEKESKIKEWLVSSDVYYHDGEEQLYINMKTAILYDGVTISVKISTFKETLYVDFLRNGNSYVMKNVYDSSGEDFSDEEKLKTAEATARMALLVVNLFYLAFNAEILGPKFIENYDFDAFCYDGIKGYDSYKDKFALATTVFIVSSVTSVLVAFLIFGSFYVGKKKKENIDKDSLLDSSSVGNNSPPSIRTLNVKYFFTKVACFFKRKDTPDKESFVMSSYKENEQESKTELKKKNRFFPHIFFEPVTRIIVILLILFSSATLFLFCVSILKMGMNIMNITKEATNMAVFLLNLKRFAGSLVCIATILHMYIKFDNYINYHNYFTNIISFTFLGIIFYVFELTMIYSAQKGLNNFSEIINVLSAYFPSNIFFGIASYSLIAMFLFYMPKRMKKTVTRQHIWRSLVIIPILYLAFSIIYNVGIKAYSWTKFPFFISLLLYQESFVTTLFVIIFCLGMFIYRKHLSKKYTKEDLKKFITGTKYLLFKNIFAASIVLVLGIIEIIFKFGVPESKATTILKLGNNYFVLIAIPILLLYRPHIGKRNPISDGTYVTFYGFAYAVGYLLVLIVVLPYINLIMPLLTNLLAFIFA